MTGEPTRERKTSARRAAQRRAARRPLSTEVLTSVNIAVIWSFVCNFEMKIMINKKTDVCGIFRKWRFTSYANA